MTGKVGKLIGGKNNEFLRHEFSCKKQRKYWSVPSVSHKELSQAEFQGKDVRCVKDACCLRQTDGATCCHCEINAVQSHFVPWFKK